MELPLMRVNGFDEVLDDSRLTDELRIELAKRLVTGAVSAMFDACGNSYVNSWLESWLYHAKLIGAYDGPVIGEINVVKEQFELWLERHEGKTAIPTAKTLAGR